MKRILFSLMALVGTMVLMKAQSINDPFFAPVPYIGAFDGTNDWTAGWTNWDPVNAVYGTPAITKGNGQFSRATGTHISANETWSGVVLLDGWVYVDNGATLTIDPGTVIRGTNKSALVIEMGAKLMAVGTSQSPIVFTSFQGAGLRANSDWAGVVICGMAPNNLPGGTGIAEGGIESPYGGNLPHDNSGVIKYVRIEFPGYEVATGKEINGLTLCSVGDATTIDYVQISYSGDDGFEWFGGTVNARHLVSYKTEDDDFDTDNGYIGRVQFGLAARDSSIVDTDAANCFESDNNEGGSQVMPKTHPVFSNISAFGPAASATSPVTLRPKYAEGSAMRLRRNTRIQIFNSIFAGWGRGLRLESEGSVAAGSIDSLTVQHTLLAGSRSNWFQTDASAGNDAIRDWFLDESRTNDTLTDNAALEIVDPFNYAARNFQPASGSPVFDASSWYMPPVMDHTIENAFFDKVNYIGAFDGTNDWTTGWVNWDPVNTDYPSATTTKGNGQFSRSTGTHIAASESWSGSVLLDGWVYVDAGAVLTIEPGTVIRGTNKSVLVIERGGKIMAEGTALNPIVFTSNQGAGLRANSDWAGLVVCGYAPNNLPGGEGIAEGGIESPYGGNDPNDNSGVLKYIRIEFPGYEVATGKEINGLTLCSVGDATGIEFIQVSNSGDDGFEWFGGTVNAKHLISYRTEDDDFDTDNGFNGFIQYALAARDSSIVDTDAANGFESDNNEGGSQVMPKTNPIFSNVSAFGPAVTSNSPSTLRPKFAEGASLRLRRNTRLQVYNSVFAGYGRGLRLESEGSLAAGQIDSLTVQNTIIAGARSNWFQTDASAGNDAVRDWFLDDSRNNDTITNNADLKITDPFNYSARNFQPMAGSPLLNASKWMVASIELTVEGSPSITVDGGSLQLKATVQPESAVDKSVSWTLMPGSVAATLSQAGLLTASSNNAGNGKVTVMAMANDGSGVSDTLSVWISGQSGAVVPVTSISVTSEGNVSTITSNSPLQINATVLPSDADVKTVSWSVDPSSLASINASGVLTPVANGVVTITATATDGSGVTGTLQITIDIPSGLHSISESRYVMYPNPVAGELTIENTGSVNRIELIDMVGCTVRSYTNTMDQVTLRDLSSLRKGIYMVVLHTSHGRDVLKINKE
jgi:hypothetical protein